MSPIAPIKDVIRKACLALGWDLTKNLEYDRLSNLIMKKAIGANSNCIDIGCHKGEIMEIILRMAPNGNHTAFEPIPELHEGLRRKFGNQIIVLPYALGDENGMSTFNHVKNAEAYSGLRQRKYDTQHPEINIIEVEVRKLDDVINPSTKIDFIKLDVEGGEFAVLKGARRILKENKPTVVFECGIGASEYYGTIPASLFQYLRLEIGMKINTLKGYIESEAPLSEAAFVKLYEQNQEYYFVAYA